MDHSFIKILFLDNKRSFKEFKQRKWSEDIFVLGGIRGNYEEQDWRHRGHGKEEWVTGISVTRLLQ